jgi:hypothetical protein
MGGIRLTAGEIDAIEWALDPMADYWCSAEGAYERDGQEYATDHLPTLFGDELVLSAVDEINSDLLYRVCEQLPDMAKSEPVATSRGQQRVSDSLHQKLTKAGVKPE